LEATLACFGARVCLQCRCFLIPEVYHCDRHSLELRRLRNYGSVSGGPDRLRRVLGLGLELSRTWNRIQNILFGNLRAYGGLSVGLRELGENGREPGGL
jgi:hypothetical protein